MKIDLNKYTLSERIRLLLRTRGETVRSLAKHLNIVERTAYARLRDSDSWRISELKSVALFLDVDYKTLLE